MKTNITHPVLGTLEIGWEYIPGEAGDMECPPSPEEYEVYEVIMNGKDAVDLLSDMAIEEIEDLLKEDLRDY